MFITPPYLILLFVKSETATLAHVEGPPHIGAVLESLTRINWQTTPSQFRWSVCTCHWTMPCPLTENFPDDTAEKIDLLVLIAIDLYTGYTQVWWFRDPFPMKTLIVIRLGAYPRQGIQAHAPTPDVSAAKRRSQ
ncbi:hypothetical protein BJ165DRAFT_167337 [Panaeolus papilionaceus]|nr:hypothetical protein BJ165DRAFT_167337 [Panaeolus papilionaceus]